MGELILSGREYDLTLDTATSLKPGQFVEIEYGAASGTVFSFRDLTSVHTSK
ncbi:MAG TPA: hypothetical protein VHY35_13070 [Stellaceae bacterium]|nr:hypothetical protein [Stellaceae bacterium]